LVEAWLAVRIIAMMQKATGITDIILWELLFGNNLATLL